MTKHVFFLGWAFCLLPAIIIMTGSKQSFKSAVEEIPAKTKGYRDIVPYENQFLAVGTEGRIDRIDKSGKPTSIPNPFKIDLNGVIYVNKMIITTGDGGKILVSDNGLSFREIKTGIRKNINGITALNGTLIAAADQRTILTSKDGNSWNNIQLPLKGNIVAVSANTSTCFGVTNKGEIIKTSDAVRWDILDYNSKYKGYNKPCVFTDVLSISNRVVVTGKHEDHTPVTLFSSFGETWTERLLNYTDDNGLIKMATNIPNSVAYDPLKDQFFLACTNGEILSLPSCTKCNKALTITEKDLYGITCSDKVLIIVGEDYDVKLLNLDPI